MYSTLDFFFGELLLNLDMQILMVVSEFSDFWYSTWIQPPV
jgi:hypothetical protein